MITERNSDKENLIFHIEKEEKQIESPIKITFSLVKEIENTNNKIIYLDKDLLSYPLRLRKRKEGDYFYPFGMKFQKKLLSKFFKDEKYSLLDKENQWILTDQKDNIIWVVEKRADERYKINEKTKNILKIEVL